MLSELTITSCRTCGIDVNVAITRSYLVSIGGRGKLFGLTMAAEGAVVQRAAGDASSHGQLIASLSKT